MTLFISLICITSIFTVILLWYCLYNIIIVNGLEHHILYHIYLLFLICYTSQMMFFWTIVPKISEILKYVIQYSFSSLFLSFNSSLIGLFWWRHYWIFIWNFSFILISQRFIYSMKMKFTKIILRAIMIIISFSMKTKYKKKENFNFLKLIPKLIWF